MEPAEAITRPSLSMAGEPAFPACDVDLVALRAERLSSLQETMRDRGVAACLFFHPANIRYATGSSVYEALAMSQSMRYCVVPATGAPVLFEPDMAIPFSSRIVDDVRQAGWWQFVGDHRFGEADRMAQQIRDTLAEFGAEGEPLAVDRVDVLAILALQRAGIDVIDAASLTDAARTIKTPLEIEMMRHNGLIGDAMMEEFQAAIRPGVSEFELLAVLSDGLLRRRGEALFSRLVASGQNTNPWGSEATDRLVEPGDLVAVDTDAYGYEGYVIDISRTFVCGDRPTQEQREAYRVAYDSLVAMREAIRPGLPYHEYAQLVPPLPEKYLSQRYDMMIHGAGLEDEGPTIVHHGKGANLENEHLQAGMVLCLESYVGELGGGFGIKLEDQVLVTGSGAESLCRFPFDDRFLS